MKIIFLTLIFILFCKNIYSYNLFDTKYFDVEFESNNIDSDKISQINQIKLKSLSNILKSTLTEDSYKNLNKYLSEDLIKSLRMKYYNYTH